MKWVLPVFVAGVAFGSAATLLPSCSTGVGGECSGGLYGLVGTMIGAFLMVCIGVAVALVIRRLAVERQPERGVE